jgi:hypothetical protein
MQTDGHPDRQTGEQAGGQTDRQKESHLYISQRAINLNRTVLQESFCLTIK